MNPLAAAPGVVRLAAGAWWRAAGWTADAYMHAGSRLMRAAVSGDSTAQLLAEMGGDARRAFRTMLGMQEETPAAHEPSTPDGDSLRQYGADLLSRSADVAYDVEAHPAYERILSELAPDEARILRLLATSGPQPAVDVRTARPLGVGSELVELGLSMIGAEAGLRYTDRVTSYLNNLFRLGLVWFSRESVRDILRYQVLEAQPDVLEAMERAGRGRTIRRSIHLTPFGEDFCRYCLPVPAVRSDPSNVSGAGSVSA